MTKEFRHGPLTHENVQRVGAAIAKVLAGKLFAVSYTTTDELRKPEILLGQYLRVDWVDGSQALVRASVDDEFASVHIQDGAYSHVYISRLKSGGDSENYKYTHFVIDHDSVLIRERLACGALKSLLFKVQGPMPFDPEEFYLRELAVHLTVAGRDAELTPEAVAALQGKTPLAVFFSDERTPVGALQSN